MLGAMAGDVIGSVFEYVGFKSKDFPLFSPESRFTDDTVMTAAVADAILRRRPYEQSMREFGRLYPRAGYGASFRDWLRDDFSKPYNSWGNGSAMRASPIGFAFDDEGRVLAEAKKSADVSHNHPEGVKGAQATALAVFLARNGADKEEMRSELAARFGYNLARTVDEIRPDYTYDISCQGTVPEAIIAFLDSRDFEDAVRNAISLGGDADTLACITGGIAQAFYGGVPRRIAEETVKRLPEPIVKVVERFNMRYGL